MEHLGLMTAALQAERDADFGFLVPVVDNRAERGASWIEVYRRGVSLFLLQAHARARADQVVTSKVSLAYPQDATRQQDKWFLHSCGTAGGLHVTRCK